MSTALFLFALLCVLSSQVQAVRWCCSGTAIKNPANTPVWSSDVSFSECLKPNNGQCVIEAPQVAGDITSTRYTPCVSDSYPCPTGGTCCKTDNCNCPTEGPAVRKTEPQINEYFGELRNILYPVIGCVFGVIWLVVAFLISALPHSLVVLVCCFANFVLGAFLLFIPRSVYTGLYFMAIGAFGIAITKHYKSYSHLILLIILSGVGFFIIAGLVNFIDTSNFFDNLSSATFGCDTSINEQNFNSLWTNVSTRCENYLLFLAAVVFFLVVIQPILMINTYALAALGGGGGGSAAPKAKKQQEPDHNDTEMANVHS